MRIVSRPRRHPGLARNRLLHRLDLFVAILASAFRDDATKKKGGGALFIGSRLNKTVLTQIMPARRGMPHCGEARPARKA